MLSIGVSDYDNPPTTRVVEVEYYDRETKWFETTDFDVNELDPADGAIRQVLIS